VKANIGSHCSQRCSDMLQQHLCILEPARDTKDNRTRGITIISKAPSNNSKAHVGSDPITEDELFPCPKLYMGNLIGQKRVAINGFYR